MLFLLMHKLNPIVKCFFLFSFDVNSALFFIQEKKLLQRRASELEDELKVSACALQYLERFRFSE